MSHPWQIDTTQLRTVWGSHVSTIKWGPLTLTQWEKGHIRCLWVWRMDRTDDSKQLRWMLAFTKITTPQVHDTVHHIFLKCQVIDQSLQTVGLEEIYLHLTTLSCLHVQASYEIHVCPMKYMFACASPMKYIY